MKTIQSNRKSPTCGNNTTTLILNDIHVPFQNPSAILSALTFGKKLKPQNIILGGDIIDFHSISRFQKNPKERNLKREISETRELLETIRKTFPKSQIFYKIGNHEARLESYLWTKAEEFSDLDELTLPNLLHFRKYRIQFVPKETVIQLGKLSCIHGHEAGNICTVYPARNLFLTSNVNTIAGHCHRQSSFVKRNIKGELIKTFTTGCLCELQADYSTFNDWVNGFGVVELDRIGNFEVDLKTI